MRPDRFTTLAEVLRENGYTTVGLTANPNINSVFNFDQGFDTYVDSHVLFPFMRPRTEQEVYKKTSPRLPRNVEHSFGPRWNDILEQKDRIRALRGFEAATLEALHSGLRAGSIWAPDSLEHRRKDELFIPAADWRRDRREYYRRLDVPLRVEQHPQPLEAAISTGLEALAEALENTDTPSVLDVVVTRDPAKMLPAADNRTLKVEKGDRPV